MGDFRHTTPAWASHLVHSSSAGAHCVENIPFPIPQWLYFFVHQQQSTIQPAKECLLGPHFPHRLKRRRAFSRIVKWNRDPAKTLFVPHLSTVTHRPIRIFLISFLFLTPNCCSHSVDPRWNMRCVINGGASLIRALSDDSHRRNRPWFSDPADERRAPIIFKFGPSPRPKRELPLYLLRRIRSLNSFCYIRGKKVFLPNKELEEQSTKRMLVLQRVFILLCTLIILL